MNATPSDMLACATASRKAGSVPTTAAVTAPAAAATTTPPPTATAAKRRGWVDRHDAGRKGVQGGPPGNGVAPLSGGGTSAQWMSAAAKETGGRPRGRTRHSPPQWRDQQWKTW